MASWRVAMRSVNAFKVALSLGNLLIRRGREMARDQVELMRGIVTVEGGARERREDRGSPVPRDLGVAGEFALDMVVVERGVLW